MIYLIWYCAMGLAVFVAVLLWDFAFNGTWLGRRFTKEIALLIIILSLLAWPFCLLFFSYGLSQRTKLFQRKINDFTYRIKRSFSAPS